ncbi:MAG: hypothetical protein EZS28_052754, partial [Streblomastix strix]
ITNETKATDRVIRVGMCVAIDMKISSIGGIITEAVIEANIKNMIRIAMNKYDPVSGDYIQLVKLIRSASAK